MDENKRVQRLSDVSYVDFDESEVRRDEIDWSPEDAAALQEQQHWKSIWKTYKD